MKNKLLILFTSFLLLLTLVGCNNEKNEVNDEIVSQEDKYNKPTAPTLEIEVTSEMDFFDDGYEIVTVDSFGDGDTTNFKLKQGVYATRYLAIDTPETSNGLDPWGQTAKDFLNDLLKNAKTIVLERDPLLINREGEDHSTLDKYDRLLAHVWVDGELVQYKLVEESLAWVKYLYYDYKYNSTLISLESYVQKVDNRRIHNDDDLDPNYDYDKTTKKIDLGLIDETYIGKNVEVEAIVTGMIGNDAYVQTEKGDAIYVYSGNKSYKNLAVGNKVIIKGGVAKYNEQLQISNLLDYPELVENNKTIEAEVIDIEEFTKEKESKLVRINNVDITKIENQNVYATVNDKELNIRFDSEVLDQVSQADLVVGSTYDLVGNVGVYKTNLQLMIRTLEDITLK